MWLRGLATSAGALAATGAMGCVRAGLDCRPGDPGAASAGPAAPSEMDAAAHLQGTPRPDDPRFDALRGLCDGVPPVDAAERAARVTRARDALGERGVAALVLEAGPSLSYFTGVGWGRSERPLQLVIFADASRPSRLVCPAFEEGTLRERLEGVGTSEFEVITWHEHDSPFGAAATGLERGAEVAFDADLRRFVAQGWRETRPDLRPTDGAPVVDGCRMVKSEAELVRLRRANEATKASLAVVATLVEPGMRETEVAALARAAQQAAGLEQVWVLALTGASAAFPHGARTDATVQAGQLVLIDTGGALHGYCSDVTRTFPVERVDDPDARRAYAAVAEAQDAALALIRAGRACGEADAAARAVIAEAGFGEGYERFTHRLGHGIGLQVHEAPYLRKDNTRVLAPGMTMSNEPGIYVPGAFGVRIEDIMAVTDGAPEVFGPRAGPVDAVFG